MQALRYDPVRQSVKPLWHESRLRSGTASPAIYNGRVYTVKSPSILVCGDAADGTVLWQLRQKGSMWASPVLAGGHAYCAGRDGLVQTVELGQEGKLVGESQLDGPVLATPAVADGALYFRTDRSLWKVAAD